MVDITALADFDGANPGGLIGIWITPIGRVTQPIPTPLYGVISSNIQLTSPFVAIEVPFIEGTGGFDENMIGEAGGNSWEQKISFQIGKDRPELRQFREELLNGKFLVFAKDANDSVKVIGSTDRKPARLTLATNANGKLPADRNNTTFELTCNDDQQAYFYTGTIP
jgi:hypothetical protein